MSPIKYPKIGVALGSGGAKGFAHIGVLKTLEANNIPIDYIAGSSIGSFIGAFYAGHKDTKKLEDVIFKFNRRKGFQLFDLAVRGGLFKGKKTERFIEETLEGATFKTLKIPFAAVATDINTAESVIFSHGNIAKAIRASISVPAFYQPLIYQDRMIADGGLSNPVPVDIVSAMGADVTIAINLDTIYVEKALVQIPPLAKIPVHSINILRHNLAQQSVKTADVVISPKDFFRVGILGWNYFFNNDKIKQIIKEGEEAAKEALPSIQLAIKAYHYRNSRRGKIFSFLKGLGRKNRLPFNS